MSGSRNGEKSEGKGELIWKRAGMGEKGEKERGKGRREW
jgi:hypothetical protein